MKFAEGKEPWDALVNAGPSNGMSDTEKGGSTDRPTGRVAASLRELLHCPEARVKLNLAL